jgi:hypothetical protein
MGACGDAPVVLVNNNRMEIFVDTPRMDALIEVQSPWAEGGDPAVAGSGAAPQ